MLDGLYHWMSELAGSGVVPSAFRHEFMVRAFLATLMLSVVLGGMSPVVVTKRMAFFGAALGHAALAGVAFGLLLTGSFDGSIIGVFGFCLLVALAMFWVRQRSQLPADTVVGVFLSLSLGLGLCLMVLVTERFDVHQIEAVLFGSIVTVTDLDLGMLVVLGVAAVVVLGPLMNGLFLGSLDPELARSRGRKVGRDELLFTVLFTLVVVAGLKLVGALLIEALVVIPAAAARNVAGGLRSYFWWSIAFAWIGTQGGLVLGYYLDVPSGAAIVLVLGGVFFAAYAVGAVRRGGGGA